MKHCCVIVLCLLAGACSRLINVDYRPIPIERRVEASPVVLVGRVERVRVAGRNLFKETIAEDKASIRVAAVLKNAVNDENLKPGATITVLTPSVNNTTKYDIDVHYKPGDEGVWLLSPHKEGYWGSLQPLDQQNAIAAIIANQEIEQQAAAEPTKQALQDRDALLATTPLYTLEQFEADLKSPDTSADLDSMRALSIHDAKGNYAGKVFVDRSGKVGLAVKYAMMEGSRFRDGLVPVSTVTGRGNTMSGYGFMDRTGRLAIAPAYENAEAFSEGLAVVGRNGLSGAINARGDLIVPIEYNLVGPLVDGVMQLRKGDRAFLADASGRIIFEALERDVRYPSEGLAPVTLSSEDSDRLWGYTDAAGELAIPPNFASAHRFSEGRAAVEVVTWVINPAAPSRVMRTLRWGFIDHRGKLVIPAWFDQVSDFDHGLAIVREGDGYGLIDASGKYVWRFRKPWLISR